MSHTPGKLSIGIYGEVNTADPGERLRLSGVALSTGYDPSRLGEHNARRLVACWNACDGIITEELEAGAIQKLREQHDELLAALRGMLDAHAVPSSICKERHAYDEARSAIAKAEGNHD